LVELVEAMRKSQMSVPTCLFPAIPPTRDGSGGGAASVANVRNIVEVSSEDRENLVPGSDVPRKPPSESVSEFGERWGAAQVRQPCSLDVFWGGGSTSVEVYDNNVQIATGASQM
jgi:hypothetical protein